MVGTLDEMPEITVIYVGNSEPYQIAVEYAPEILGIPIKPGLGNRLEPDSDKINGKTVLAKVLEKILGNKYKVSIHQVTDRIFSIKPHDPQNLPEIVEKINQHPKDFYADFSKPPEYSIISELESELLEASRTTS